MQKFDIAIIGASAAGVTAALTARRHYPEKSIVVIRKEKLVPIPCGIPYAFGVVGTPEKNLIPADDMFAKNNVTSIIGEAVAISRKDKNITLNGNERIDYDRLIIATGSNPVIPPIPGKEKRNVFAIQKDVPYLQQVIDALQQVHHLCIVGCGFIGVEIAEECKRRKPDLKVTIVEMLTHCLQLVYDEDFCLKAESSLKEQGIDLFLDEKVVSFEGNDSIQGVKLGSGRLLDSDMVILGIGAASNTAIAMNAGLDIGPTKGIQVNRYMQTSDNSIYACGDCAEKVSFFDGKPSALKLASIATMEARVAGANLFSTNRVNMGVIGVYSTVIGNCAFAAAGLTRSQAVEKGYDVVIGESEAVNRHPGCMPDAAMLKVKLLFEAGSQVLIGGQVTGAKSSGELINTTHIGSAVHSCPFIN